MSMMSSFPFAGLEHYGHCAGGAPSWMAVKKNATKPEAKASVAKNANGGLRACLENCDRGGFPVSCEYDSHF
jgi:hypothetical protein